MARGPYSACLENLTHALVGLLCAEGAVRVRERTGPMSGWVRTAVYGVAIVGNNLPDLDFSYAQISGKRFGYLLQHRGYTHTVPAALGFALLTLLLLLAHAKWRHKTVPQGDWWLLTGLALISPLLHIAMDFANNYGVHPFWPAYSGWLYGDSFFILEPSFWLAVVAPLSFSYRSRVVRAGLGLILAVGLGALWYRPLVPRGNAVVLALLTLVLLMLARRQSPFARLLMACTAFLVAAGSFVCGSRLAKGIVRERAQLAFPAARTLDIVVTPMPANPLCWNVLLVQVDGQDYAVELGRAAVLPAWLSADACPYDRAAKPTAPLRATQVAPTSSLILSAEYRAPLAELRAVARDRCEARALLRFARVPYLGNREADGSRVIGDLRYDRVPGLDFSDVRLDRTPLANSCPQYVPAWLPPRQDLL